MSEEKKIERVLENWTKFPNYILDNLEKINGNELKILSLIVRKTLGYTTPNKKFSINYLSVKLNVSKNTVVNCINSLVSLNYIEQVGTDSKDGSRLYDIAWKEPIFRIDRKRKLDKKNSISKNSISKFGISKNDTGGVPKFDTNERNNKKETIKKKETIYRENLDFNSFMKLYKDTYKSKTGQLDVSDFFSIEKLFAYCKESVANEIDISIPNVLERLFYTFSMDSFYSGKYTPQAKFLLSISKNKKLLMVGEKVAKTYKKGEQKEAMINIVKANIENGKDYTLTEEEEKEIFG